MSYQKYHSANFLIRKYLKSYTGHAANLDSIDVGILRTIADLMDSIKDNRKKPPEDLILYGLQENIAKEARISRSRLNPRIKKYIKLNILKQLTNHRGRSNKFSFGDAVFKHDNSFISDENSSAVSAQAMYENQGRDISSAVSAQASAVSAQASAVSAHIYKNKALNKNKALLEQNVVSVSSDEIKIKEQFTGEANIAPPDKTTDVKILRVENHTRHKWSENDKTIFASVESQSTSYNKEKMFMRSEKRSSLLDEYINQRKTK